MLETGEPLIFTEQPCHLRHDPGKETFVSVSAFRMRGASGRTLGVTTQLHAWGLDDMALTTELIVSELITNAYRYSRGPATLRLIRDHHLICEVSDTSSISPHLRHAATTDEGGRGLFLVAQLTARWGTRYVRNGKTIWAEQECEPPSSGPEVDEAVPASRWK